MPSTPSTNLRIELQETGENLNTWGIALNSAIQRIEEALTKIVTKSLTGDYTLTSVNYTTDEARSAMLSFTDGGLSAAPTITVPAVSKFYFVLNSGATYDINFTAGNTSAAVRPGTFAIVYCDGTDCFNNEPTLDLIKKAAANVDLDSHKIINLTDPTAAQDAATKNYIDTLAASSDLGTVAAIADDISTVAGIATSVPTVAAIDDDISTVAGIAGHVTTVANRDADIGTVADRDADIGTLADIEDGTTATGAIRAVAAVASNVTTVAGISDDVTTVAGNNTDISTIAGSIADVNTCADNIADIQAAAALSEILVFDDTAAAEAATVASTIKTLIVGGENFIRVTADYAGLGPELITNGDFGSSTGWALGTGWAISGGVATFTGPASNGVASQTISIVNGTAYYKQFDITAQSGDASCGVWVFGDSRSAFDTVDHHAEVGLCLSSGNGAGLIANATTGSLSVDNVSIKALPDSAFKSADGQWWVPALALGDLATKDKASVSDIDATGTASGSTFLAGDGSWKATNIVRGTPAVLSNDASADFTIDSTKDETSFHFKNVVPATDAVNLLILASTDSGSTFAESIVLKGVYNSSTAANGYQVTATTTGAALNETGDTIGSDTNEFGLSGVLTFRQASGEYALFEFIGSFISSSSGALIFITGGGEVQTTSAITTIRFKFSSGNMESGTIVPVTLGA